MIGQIFSIVISLIGLRLLTELAPASVLGEAALWLGVLTLLRNVIVAPISNTQMRFHPQYISKGLISWFNNQISIRIKRATLLLLLVLVTVFLIFSLVKQTLSLYLLGVLILYVTADAVKNFKLNILSAERKQKFIAIWSSVDTLFINASFLLLLLFFVSTESYLFGQVIGSVVGIIIFGYIVYPNKRIDKNEPAGNDYTELKRNIFSYGIPFILIALLSWITNLGDRYIIGSLMTVEEVGLYTAAYSIASRPFTMLNGIISSFLRPILFQAESFKEKQKGNKIFSGWLFIVLLVSISGVVVFYFFGDFIASLLLAEDYRRLAPQIFVLVGCGYAFLTIVQVFENRFLSFQKSSSLLIPSIFAASFNIASNFILIPELGIIGAAVSTVIAFFVQLVVIIILWFSNERSLVKSV